MHRFAPAPRISRPLSRVGAPVPVATARVQPTLAAKLPGPGAEFDGCVAVQGSWLAVYYAYMWLSASVPSDASEKQKSIDAGVTCPALLDQRQRDISDIVRACAEACGSGRGGGSDLAGASGRGSDPRASRVWS